MNVSEIDTSQMEFSEEELDAMVEILTKAEEIKADPPLLKLVEKHGRKKVKSIESMSDLRRVASDKALEDKGDD